MKLEAKVIKEAFPPRVGETAEHLSLGESYKDVARQLEIDTETVKSYAAMFRRIMEAKSTGEAVAKAIARGIISITENGGKTMLIACLIFSAGMPDKHAPPKTKTKLENRIERRVDEI
jgi:DNA-binding CsgD family transcriptional regulator